MLIVLSYLLYLKLCHHIKPLPIVRLSTWWDDIVATESFWSSCLEREFQDKQSNIFLITYVIINREGKYKHEKTGVYCKTCCSNSLDTS